jgi:beta-lactam-binding protein with PASTA domain/predicted Ser/Thr protein kinase
MTTSALLGGRYEVGEVLGVGGMSEVRIGRDVRLGRPVAIKLLRSDLARDPTFQSRFRREAQSAASLNHPSIVAVFDTGEERTEDGTSSYIVMEYVEGRTLRQVLDAEGRLLPQRALEITAQVCSALDEAHRAGIVHRDVKPGNVMLTPAGEVKVMDFGIARAMTGLTSTMTQTAAVIGTAHYLSPEQARGEHVDARSDVYSTGCLLYELLTGSPPFVGDSAISVAYQHVREDPVPPSRVDPDVPTAVDAIVLKAMAKNPANRYQSAAELRADIDRALAGRPVEATPVLADETRVLTPPPPTTVLLRHQQPRTGRGFAYLMLAVATLAVFILAVLVGRSLLAGGGSEVNTPDVRGQTLQQAEEILAGKGLKVGTVRDGYSGRFDAGQVMAQDPAPDLLLNKGEAVNLVVSRGIHKVPVPNQLVGLSLAEAKSVLASADLTLGQVVPRNSSAPAGQVLDVSPAAGSQVPIHSKVDLVVSNGQVRVPDVVGQDLTLAEAQLQQAGFTVTEKPAAVYDRHQPDNVIVSQTPAGGSFAPIGADHPVTIYYNQHPTPSPTPSSASPSPSPTGSTSPSPSPSAT